MESDTNLFPETNSILNRREFFNYLAAISGGACALVMLTDVQSTTAQITAVDDARLHTEHIKYAAEGGEMRAYLARPQAEGKYPGVIVIHENRGLNAHIEDVTRRVALEGFLAIAPDALSPFGGTPEDMEKVRALFQELDYAKTVKNFVAAVKYLQTNPLCTGKVGCTGFCWGGAMTNQVAVNSPDLLAAVPYYGRQPEAADVPKIKAAMLLHYASNDARINEGIEAFEKALQEAKVEHSVFIYEGAEHAFNNDTNPERYNKEAAELAWGRTIAFFKEKLKS
ncbi:MAG TPA: dienelactone hydrolase family protein [bacterium]|nr:dienelactone hydrolase family protein [bacterium]HPN45326.1 dienelactone hydrolase family protein [bacterium]